jgi:hypothetical protein
MRPGDKDALLCFPTNAADATGARGVHYVTPPDNTAVSVPIPASMKGMFLRIIPFGGGVQAGVSFGAAGQALVWNQASALGTGHVARGAHADAAGGPRWIEGIVPHDATFLNYIREPGQSVSLEIWCTEAPDSSLIVGDRAGF